jgi:hypothetical protein
MLYTWRVCKYENSGPIKFLCKISASHTNIAEDEVFLYVMPCHWISGYWLFKGLWWLYLQGRAVLRTFLGLLSRGDEVTKILWNVRNHAASDTASYPKDLNTKSSCLMLSWSSTCYLTSHLDYLCPSLFIRVSNSSALYIVLFKDITFKFQTVAETMIWFFWDVAHLIW